ncbi:MAG: ATP-binding protein [Gammaproteobacteria bacterium]|nr:ATP-binding protein [Gammaproteobacteria bacterium]
METGFQLLLKDQTMASAKLNIANNPFTAGHGKVPPFLAGREDDKHKLYELLGRTIGGEVVTSNLYIFAPRGMGKTSLLEQVGKELKSLNRDKGKSAVIMTAVNAMQTVEEARKTLIDDIGISFRNSLLPEKVIADLNILSAQWSAKEKSWSSVCGYLAEKCRKRPVVFMVDEAHRLSPDVLAAVVDDIEMIRRKDGPVVGVFAGKPLLLDVIGEAGVSYEERSDYISLDLLNDRDSAAAIEYPMSTSSIKITRSAMNQVVEDAQGYPTYLQYWGSELWKLGIEKTGQNVIGEADVALVRPEISKRKQLADQSRFDRWSKEDSRLLVSLTERLRDIGGVNRLCMEEMIEEELERQGRNIVETDRIFRKMIETDYVWSPLGTTNYKAALPSYFSFILGQEMERAAQQKSA